MDAGLCFHVDSLYNFANNNNNNYCTLLIITEFFYQLIVFIFVGRIAVNRSYLVCTILILFV